MRTSSLLRGGFRMMSASGGLKPNAVAGGPSVTKFTHSSWTGIRPSGIPRAAVRNIDATSPTFDEIMYLECVSGIAKGREGRQQSALCPYTSSDTKHFWTVTKMHLWLIQKPSRNNQWIAHQQHPLQTTWNHICLRHWHTHAPDEGLHVVVDWPTLRNGRDNGAEVIIGQDHIWRFLGNLDNTRTQLR